MTYHERDAWDTAGDMGNGIEGQHLKCAKGKWLLDDAEIETGEDGLKKIVERNIGRLSDGFLPLTPATITEKWNPYIAVLGVRCDAGHLGELLTFTSSSWGGWFAFQRLINPWRLKGRTAFPVCTLSTKERHDENRNVTGRYRPLAKTGKPVGNHQRRHSILINDGGVTAPPSITRQSKEKPCTATNTRSTNSPPHLVVLLHHPATASRCRIHSMTHVASLSTPIAISQARLRFSSN
jgi:hypothetical protein